MKLALILAVFCVPALLATPTDAARACGSYEDFRQEALEEVRFDGVWSTEWGNLHLSQEGDRVTGTYDHDGGRIEGTVVDGVLRYRWFQASGRRGRGEFTISPEDGSIAGTWTYLRKNGRVAPGGTWSGRRTTDSNT